jgi:hypothetical protein
MNRSRSYISINLFLNVLALAAVPGSFAAYWIRATGFDQDRYRVRGYTLIFHGGEVVIRTPADRLVTVEAFTQIEWVQYGCVLYLTLWVSRLGWRAMTLRIQRANGGRRGFPLD